MGGSLQKGNNRRRQRLQETCINAAGRRVADGAILFWRSSKVPSGPLKTRKQGPCQMMIGKGFICRLAWQLPGCMA
ncbi:hypothetical protein EV132_102258 [Rhizobium sullae]|uniref:Uncharacterized protein n=1 Tax=Rhizobium sullae TaxID=50338 RepID=A0A4R3QDL3_RHISU|nr:hypothetical protein EV132_102258 [Rhizobium sullae]